MVELIAADDRRALARAVALLADGEVIAIPTDTVYGLAVDPALDGATDRLFAAKRRPRDVTLPVFVTDAAAAAAIADVTPLAATLLGAYWPGELTVVLRRLPSFDADLGSNADTVGVRCPDHSFVRALTNAVGRPLAVTSANLHGQETPAGASEVAAELGASIGLVVDAGRCAGEPSTVVDATGTEPVVLRQGALRL